MHAHRFFEIERREFTGDGASHQNGYPFCMWYPPKYHRTMQKSGLRMVCGVPHTPTHTVRHGSLHSDPTKLDMGPRTSIPPSHGWLQWVARLGHRAGRDSLPASLVAFQLGTAAADRPGAALPGRPWVPPLQSLLGAPPLTTPTPSNLQPSPPPASPASAPRGPRGGLHQ